MICERCFGDTSQGEHGLNLCPLEPRPAAYVAGDDIPGGLVMHHGICHPDGTPKTYYTRSSIRKACAEIGAHWGPDVKPTPRNAEARERALEKSEQRRRERRG